MRNRSSVPPPHEDRAPLLSHLLALRRVSLIYLFAVVAAFFLVYYLCLDSLMAWITRPITSRGIDIIYTAVAEALTTKIKVGIIAALVISSPVIIWQFWSFIRPALMPKSRRAFWTAFLVILLLFLLGVFFSLFAVYNLALDFFFVQSESLAKPMFSLDKYVSFLFGFVIPFGVAFQLPFVLYLTTRAGLTTVRGLCSKRKYVIFGIFVFAAVLTPPDVVSQIALGIPLCLLYEAGILAARVVRRKENGESTEPFTGSKNSKT